MSSTRVGGPFRTIARWPVGNHPCKWLLLALVAATLLLVGFSSDAEAAKRRGRNRHGRRAAAAAARARKARIIKSVQQQVAVARRVLAAAEARTAMSQTEVNQALAKLTRIHDEIENAHVDIQQAAKTQHEIEAEILSEQPADSALTRAQTAMEEAKKPLHRVMHGIVRLPDDEGKTGDAARLDDLAKLSPGERELLERDAAYQIARKELQAAAQNLTQLREKLFAADPDWAAAHQDLLGAEKRAREGNRQAETGALNSRGDREDLRKSWNVAAMTRSIIAQGEVRLRQLGVKSARNQGWSRSKRKK